MEVLECQFDSFKKGSILKIWLNFNSEISSWIQESRGDKSIAAFVVDIIREQMEQSVNTNSAEMHTYPKGDKNERVGVHKVI